MRGRLTTRERQILKMYLAEYRLKEISSTLNLSMSTVSTFKRKVMDKWDVETEVGLIKESIKRGYLEIEEDTFCMECLVYTKN
jgi:DNA-binding NarL/FixJ family response regulator